jgi:hypothetical protein
VTVRLRQAERRAAPAKAGLGGVENRALPVTLSSSGLHPILLARMNARAAVPAALLYGSSSLPDHLKRHVSNTAFEAAVNEIDEGRYPDMHLVFPGTRSDASRSASFDAASACVRVYVGSQAAAAVPDKPGILNLDEWKARKLAALQQSRISVILCCCNDGSGAEWKPFENSGIRFA